MIPWSGDAGPQIPCRLVTMTWFCLVILSLWVNPLQGNFFHFSGSLSQPEMLCYERCDVARAVDFLPGL